jgi:hypothetical protein
VRKILHGVMAQAAQLGLEYCCLVIRHLRISILHGIAIRVTAHSSSLLDKHLL